MDSKLHNALSSSAFYARRAIIPASLFILALSFFLIDCSRWSNGLTVFEAILGITGLWLTLEIFKIGMDISHQQTADSARQSEQQTQLIKNVQTMLLTSIKINHIQELGRKYEETKDHEDEMVKNHWHFAFRFETWTTMIIQLDPEEDGIHGHASIRVIGYNKPVLEVDLEKFDLPIYTVEVTDVQHNKVLKLGRAYCTCINGNILISNDANEAHLHAPTLNFSIVGHTGQARAVRPKPPNYSRMINLTDFSETKTDRT